MSLSSSNARSHSQTLVRHRMLFAVVCVCARAAFVRDNANDRQKTTATNYVFICASRLTAWQNGDGFAAADMSP